MWRHWDLRSFKNTFMAVETSASQRLSAASSERKPWIAFKNLQLQTRSLTFAPQPGSMSRAIQERASVGARNVTEILDGRMCNIDISALRLGLVRGNIHFSSIRYDH
jgi:hypothetical protein